MNKITSNRLRNIILVPLGIFSLSACVYGGAGGYQSGYQAGFDEYCDPYNQYDAYYGCDVEYGFANIGYGGGWHQNFFYPGFGFFIFDRGGQRFRMNDFHRGYWGAQRQSFFRSRFSDQRFSGRRLRRFERNQGDFARGDRRDRRQDGRAVRRDERAEGERGNRQGRDRQRSVDQSGEAASNERPARGTSPRAQRGRPPQADQAPPRTRQPRRDSSQKQRSEPRSESGQTARSRPPRARPERPKTRANGTIRRSPRSRNRDVVIP